MRQYRITVDVPLPDDAWTPAMFESLMEAAEGAFDAFAPGQLDISGEPTPDEGPVT